MTRNSHISGSGDTVIEAVMDDGSIAKHCWRFEAHDETLSSNKSCVSRICMTSEQASNTEAIEGWGCERYCCVSGLTASTIILEVCL